MVQIYIQNYFQKSISKSEPSSCIEKAELFKKFYIEKANASLSKSYTHKKSTTEKVGYSYYQKVTHTKSRQQKKWGIVIIKKLRSQKVAVFVHKKQNERITIKKFI